MPVVNACPEREVLQQLMLGQVSDRDVGPLSEHLLQCERCAQAVESLQGSDTLFEAVRAARTGEAQREPSAVVQGLIAQLKAMRPSAPPPDATQALHPDAAPAGGVDPDVLACLAPAQRADEIGRLAHYRVLKVLGSGGMGMVFKAEDTQLDRPVALKVMRPEMARKSEHRQRFLREAKATAALKHDNIVSIYQVGEDSGVVFLAIEFLAGEALDHWLERGKKPTIPQVLKLGREIAKGLSVAHERGLIHRDIKPGNIWLEAPAGRVKILDFGLARAAGGDNLNLTQSGMIVGTPAYMAPEQARSEAVDSRSDLFSLGCVLYRLCTGQTPFQGKDTISLLSALALDTPKPVRDLNAAVPQALNDLVMQLLAKDSAQRPQSAKEVVQRIQEIERGLAGRPAAATAGAPEAQVRSAPVGEKREQDLTQAGSPVAATPQAAPGKTSPKKASGETAAVPAGRGNSRRRWPLLLGAAAALVAVAVAAPIILRITRKDGTKQDIVLNPGDRYEVVPQQPPVKPGASSPFDALRPEDIPADNLSEAGGGDPAKAPADLVGAFGTPSAQGWIGTLFVSPDGRRVYPAGKGAMRTLDAATGKAYGKLFPNVGKLVGASTYYAHTRDGNRIACANEAYGVTIVNPTTGTEQITFARKEGNGFGGLAFRPDGERLALIHGPDRQSRKVEIWDAVRGQMLRTLDGQGDAVELVAYSADGARLATASANATIKIWDPESGKELRSIPTATKGKLLGLWFSPDGTEIGLTAGNSFQTWEVATGAQRLSMPGVVAACWSPDGKWLATWAKSDKQLCLRESGTGKIQRTWTLPAEVNVIAFAPDGRHVLTGTTHGIVCVLRLAAAASVANAALTDRQAAEKVLSLPGGKVPVLVKVTVLVGDKEQEVTDIKDLPAGDLKLIKIGINGRWPGGNEWMQCLRGLTHLTHLGLRNNALVGDDDLRHVQGLTSLVGLSLHNTAVGDAGLAHLTGLSNLQVLYLHGTAVTDAGLNQLKGLTNLQQVWVDKTKVTAAGAAELKKALPKCLVRGFGNEPEPPPE